MMRPVLHLLVLENFSIFRQLQVEEALLRADDQNWCIINCGTPSAIVMGISGIPEELLKDEFIKNPHIPLIRRFSGGGTVVVDHDTIFSTFICNANDIAVPCYPGEVLQWTRPFYENVFDHAEFQVRENDYAIGEKKCGGNAQYFRKDRWLHHTSFLWDYQPAQMELLCMPKRTPKYRSQRSHQDFLYCLKQHIPEKKSIPKRIREALSKQFIVQEHPLQSVEEALLRPHRKATSKVWEDSV